MRNIRPFYPVVVIFVWQKELYEGKEHNNRKSNNLGTGNELGKKTKEENWEIKREGEEDKAKHF